MIVFPVPNIHEQRCGYPRKNHNIASARRSWCSGGCLCRMMRFSAPSGCSSMVLTRRFTSDVVIFITNHNIACESELQHGETPHRNRNPRVQSPMERLDAGHPYFEQCRPLMPLRLAGSATFILSIRALYRLGLGWTHSYYNFGTTERRDQPVFSPGLFRFSADLCKRANQEDL